MDFLVMKCEGWWFWQNTTSSLVVPRKTKTYLKPFSFPSLNLTGPVRKMTWVCAKEENMDISDFFSENMKSLWVSISGTYDKERDILQSRNLNDYGVISVIGRSPSYIELRSTSRSMQDAYLKNPKTKTETKECPIHIHLIISLIVVRKDGKAWNRDRCYPTLGPQPGLTCLPVLRFIRVCLEDLCIYVLYKWVV
jgi:hypothetical protein